MDHLSKLATSRGFSLPAKDPHPDKWEKRDAKDFDRDYLEQMIDDHESAVKLFEKQAKDGEDIEATARHLAKIGIPLASPLDPARRGVDRNRGMWIEDPDGNRIEVMEMAKNCIQWEAVARLKAGGGKTSLLAPRGGPKKVTAA